jgi:MFS family permease
VIIDLDDVGTLYSYSAYSADLQQTLSYTGTQVNIVSSIGDLGLYVGGIPMGIFYDKYGPRLSYIVSSLCLFLGYVLMWLGVIQKIPSGSIMMGLYMTLVGYGSVVGNMAGLLTNSKNFPAEKRGKIVALLVAANGLSAAIFSQIYQRVLSHDVSRFFWLLALILGMMPVLGIFLVKSVKVSSGHLAPQIDSPIISNVINSTNEAIVNNWDVDADVGFGNQNLEYASLPPHSLEATPDSSSRASNGEASVFQSVSGKYGDIRGLPVMKSPDFWLLFAVVFCCTGVGLTWINIVGNIVKSYQITAIPASGYVISLSLANTAGRIIFGLATDLKIVSLPPIYLLLPCLFMLILTHAMLIWITNYAVLLFVTITTGLSYGGSFAVMPVIINKYYGDKNYGSNLGLLILAVALGSMSMGAVSGALYDKEALAQKTVSSAVRHLTSGSVSYLCFGIDCFRWTFVMTTVVSVIGIVIAAFLLRREIRFDSLCHSLEHC